MNQLLSQLFDTSRYTSFVERDRARMVYGMTLLLALLTTIYVTLTRSASTGENIWQQATHNATTSYYLIFFYGSAVGAFVATRFGYTRLAGGILVVMWAGSFGQVIVQSGMYDPSSVGVLQIVILLAGLLNGTRGLIAGIGLAILMSVFGIVQRDVQGPPSTWNSGTNLFNAILNLMTVSGMTYLFLRYARLARAEGVAVATQDRLKMAEIAARITQRVAQRISLTELLNDIVTRVCEEFADIYHAQVFLIDPRGDSARLVASTGPVGKKLIEQQHSLGVGSLSVIGQVTYQGKSIVAQAGSSESVHRRNEFLPDTQSEAAFPLKIGTVVIGALDLQSKRREAFTPGLVEAFSSLADSVALAIDNVRQFERAEARIHENQQLVEQTRTALREVERLNERLTGRAWSEYLRGRREDLGVEIDFETNAVNPENDWTNTMAEAIQFNHFVQEQQADRQVIAIPLRVRGQVVGAMEFELDEQQTFTPEDLSLVQEVSDRFGLAAENTRLVEESQRIAQREALVNEISSRLQAANNIEATLTEAARSLRDALKANKVAIRLGAPPASNGS